MNYRHAFHAGNFADVFKHAVLARILEHLKRKDAPFRVLDTHAGIGLYDLAGDEAGRTEEWHDGIGRLTGPFATQLPAALEAFLAPYRAALAVADPEGTGRFYPGSPMVARALMRPGDGLTLTELHPADCETLKARFAEDRLVKVIQLDGWLALKSFLPFKERRGLVLVDPPFEAPDEFTMLVRGLADAHARAATLTLMFWYPVKEAAAVRRFVSAVAASGVRKVLRAELAVATPGSEAGLSASGLVVVNPPWQLDADLKSALPLLAQLLARGHGAGARVEWLVPE